jgi:predicted adenylyl cyclase CyaB
MGKNLEIKVKVENHIFYLEKIKKLDFSSHFEIEQRDYYFDSNFGLLKLRLLKDNSELIYYKRDEKNSERWSDYKILHLQNEDNPLGFLSNIFKQTIVVAKNRVVYVYKNTRIHLDVVENLGKFIELETVVENDLSEARLRFQFLVDYLELDFENQIKNSYKNLIEEYVNIK